MKIENGNIISDNYCDYILISRDDIHYDYFIRKSTVSFVEYKINSAGWFVILSYNGSKFYEFNLAKIINQPTWTLDQTGVDTAVNDIIRWIKNPAISACYTSIVASSTSQLLFDTNQHRVEAIIWNNTNKKMYIKYNSVAELNKGIEILKGDAIIIDTYKGDVYAIWESGVSGTAEITEVIT